jgi:hypothetical protein
MLVALAISSALLTATMVSLNASFIAYQRTTEQASTHTVARLVMNRMLTLIRSGEEFGPFPISLLDTVVESDEMQFRTRDGDVMTLRWVEHDALFPRDNALYIIIGPDKHLLLEGVMPQYGPDEDGDGFPDQISPFTLEYEVGRKLYRATIDLLIQPDDNLSTDLDGTNTDQLRMVASAMPRAIAYEE